MKHQKHLNNAALAGIVVMGMSAISTSALAGKPGFEKCYGVAKTGMNDCGTAKHACAGQASKDSDPNEWVYVPEGTCKKLAGGALKTK